jgi:hypothetical protein
LRIIINTLNIESVASLHPIPIGERTNVRGNEHPHPFPPPSEGEDEGGGEKYKIIPLA